MKLYLKYAFLILMFSKLSLKGVETEVSPQTAHFIQHVDACIQKARVSESQLTQEILNLPGMSSHKVRHLLNNICSLPETSYLEVGVWKGSTFISALYNNHPSQSIGIDNFSEFLGPKTEFIENCQKYLQKPNYYFYEGDCFSIEKDKFFQKPINIYFYDGNHSVNSHELSLLYFENVFDEAVILIVDDWNASCVQLGTVRGLQKINYAIQHEVILPAKFNGDKDLWWNGVYIAVLQRKKA